MSSAPREQLRAPVELLDAQPPLGVVAAEPREAALAIRVTDEVHARKVPQELLSELPDAGTRRTVDDRGMRRFRPQ